MKKQFSIVSLGAVAAILTMSIANGTPVLASLWNAGTKLAQSQAASQKATQQKITQKAQVQLHLSGEKQVVNRDEQGNPITSWQALDSNATAQPGDILRFTLNSENTSDRAVKNLVLTQPIPKGTMFVLKSATNERIQVTYSIDSGRTFVTHPMVQVKLPDGKIEEHPAPAEAYTHIRWNVGTTIAAKSALQVAYQVKVR